MKRYVMAAGALLLGTSLLGLSADAQTSDKSVYAAKLATMDKAAIAAKSDLAMSTDTKVEMASVDMLPADKAAELGMGGPDEVVATTAVAVPASAAVVEPSNANPERDARGIAVISDVAHVPPGWNGIAGGAMGGPVEGDDADYPPCTAERTDNCVQTYERGRSD
jgi:hypothetical protein